MRQAVNSARVRAFMSELGRRLRRPVTVYLVGGASAVLEGWRDSTTDIDCRIDPDDEVYSQLGLLKNDLDMNVELAAPDQFLPELPGWRERSTLIGVEGSATFRHYDFHAQALAKIERGFDQDRNDVRAMLARGLVDPALLRSLAAAIVPDLIRFPAVDAERFEKAVERFLEQRDDD